MITGWNWGAGNTQNIMMFSGTNPPGCTGCRVVDGTVDQPFWGAEVDNSPGTWSAATATPEPTSFFLLGSGLLALVGNTFKKNAP
jgi:hypothetical protein